LNDAGVSNQDLGQKIVKLFELNAYLSKRVVETAGHLKGNSSKLAMTADMQEKELAQLTGSLSGLQVIFVCFIFCPPFF
jgi:hypothetical protein